MTQHDVLLQQRERAFLVGLGMRSSHPLMSIEDSLEELTLLADTAGMDIVGQTQQNVAHIDPATFIGSGKIDEIKEMLLASEAQVVIFDDELSPRHQRGLENRFGEQVKVLDRSALILDIFAQHARTREGSLQVELAQYEYRLPRLTRAWSHLARLGGGIGTRGPGETQLEVDRRDIRRRISKLKDEIENVRAHRGRQRDQRDRTGIPLIALVGYTNAGKSTLLKALTGADVYIANQLFATLDPTTRRLDLPSGRQALISDTVGFIQKLPTTLIAAFRATLEEINDADLILEVADINHPNVVQHLETVEDTLAEIDVPPVPRILVWNKVDRWGNKPIPEVADLRPYSAQVTVSATKNTGLDQLLEAVEKALTQSLYEVTLRLPFERGDLASLLHEMGSVQAQSHTEDGIVLKVRLTHDLYERYKEYRV
jgi:GTP-binding protein HflX